jgi:hypothetical protein
MSVCAFDKRKDHMYMYHCNFLQNAGFLISSSHEGERGCVFPSGSKG